MDEAAAARQPLQATRWAIWDAVIAAVGAFALAIVAGAFLYGFGLLTTGVGLLIGTLVPWIAMGGWPLFVAARYGNGAQLDFGLRLTWRDVGIGVLAGFAALILGGLAAYATQWVIGDFSSAAGDAAVEIARSGEMWQLVLFAILVVAGAPIVEELLFRGLLWAGLARRGWGPWTTGITTTVVFGLFHFEPSRIVVLLVIGGVLAFVRYRTRALGAPIICHAVNNLPGALGMLALASG